MGSIRTSKKVTRKYKSDLFCPCIFKHKSKVEGYLTAEKILEDFYRFLKLSLFSRSLINPKNLILKLTFNL